MEPQVAAEVAAKVEVAGQGAWAGQVATSILVRAECVETLVPHAPIKRRVNHKPAMPTGNVFQRNR